MTRLFRQDEDFTICRVKEFLDECEDSAKVSRRMIAELEGALAEARALASARLADRDEWRRRVAAVNVREQGWGEKAELALSLGRADLARAALVEKQKAAAEAASVASEAVLIDELTRDSRETIARIQSLLRELKALPAPSRQRLAYN